MPIWRATKAAWEETPPRAVNIPSAAIIPRKSSGEVSWRTSNTFPDLAASTARSAFKQTRPDAAPGPAGNPLQRVAAAFWAAASKTGAST